MDIAFACAAAPMSISSASSIGGIGAGMVGIVGGLGPLGGGGFGLPLAAWFCVVDSSAAAAEARDTLAASSEAPLSFLRPRNLRIGR